MTEKEKRTQYDVLYNRMNAYCGIENKMLPLLSNAAALIFEEVADLNWAGFYLMEEGELILGPFQGKAARMRIAVGDGVCGTAVAKDQTQVVKDVHQFEGHIACDCASNAEIVIPIHYNNEVVAVLDIDSPVLGRFDEEDKAGLEKLVHRLEKAIIW